MNGYGAESDLNSRVQERTESALGQTVPKQAPPMDVSMRTLGQNIERLQQAVHVLQGKLEPVLYPEPPSPATPAARANDASSRRASSGLGSSINNFSDQVEGIAERVSSLIRRCEL